jgi:O-acetyl-ADP-ribose deacetylase (regulator of RNase III)
MDHQHSAGDLTLRDLVVEEVGDLRAIAFSAVSTGVYGFPAERAARIAVATTVAADAAASCLETVIFCCFSETSAGWHQQALSEIAPP